MFIKSPMNKQIFVGIYTVAMFHVGAKSALLRRLFMPMAKKMSSARSLAPPFFFQRFPRRNRAHSVPPFKIAATLLGRDLGRPMRVAIPMFGTLEASDRTGFSNVSHFA